MMIKKADWSRETKKIFNGILLYSIAGILYGIFDPIESLTSTVSSISSYAGAGSMPGSGLISTICYALLVAIIFGYVLTFLGLTGFRTILETNDANAIGKVRTAFILAIIAAGVGFIPLMGWVGGILNIVAFILMLLGYSALKSSSTFPELGRKGASTLFVALILLLVGVVVGFIPFIGGIFNGILSIIAYIMTLLGWKKIVSAAVELQ